MLPQVTLRGFGSYPVRVDASALDTETIRALPAHHLAQQRETYVLGAEYRNQDLVFVPERRPRSPRLRLTDPRPDRGAARSPEDSIARPPPHSRRTWPQKPACRSRSSPRGSVTPRPRSRWTFTPRPSPPSDSKPHSSSPTWSSGRVKHLITTNSTRGESPPTHRTTENLVPRAGSCADRMPSTPSPPGSCQPYRRAQSD